MTTQHTLDFSKCKVLQNVDFVSTLVNQKVCFGHFVAATFVDFPSCSAFCSTKLNKQQAVQFKFVMIFIYCTHKNTVQYSVRFTKDRLIAFVQSATQRNAINMDLFCTHVLS